MKTAANAQRAAAGSQGGGDLRWQDEAQGQARNLSQVPGRMLLGREGHAFRRLHKVGIFKLVFFATG